METITIRRYPTPCGPLLLGSIDGRICMCDWIAEPRHTAIDRRLRRRLGAGFAEGTSPVIEKAVEQLDEYFSGLRQQFDIPLLFAGTRFQESVWQAMLDIPYGHTVSYLSLATRLGNPRGVRAVAGAVGANSMSILVPCHRVIGRDNSLTGYAGGLDTKRLLLNLEGAI
ncbi:MAG: methylated-DNA--[protein]-cysteine S-methyltransferase [Pseudoflavonifractor sp.]|nr:methylated-DNA--[protein]-cysteine S-methyltransferase [Pseudoflavonifractor sp.]